MHTMPIETGVTIRITDYVTPFPIIYLNDYHDCVADKLHLLITEPRYRAY